MRTSLPRPMRSTARSRTSPSSPGRRLAAGRVALSGPGTVVVINAASFALSALLVARIKVRSRPVDVTEEGEAGAFAQMLVGVRTILHSPSARVPVAFCGLVSFVYGTDTVLFV